jgi:flavin-dependent dehydrogenase
MMSSARKKRFSHGRDCGFWSKQMKRRFDICVIGAGPTGSAFAILMARKGARVALVEKSDFRAFRLGERLPPPARCALPALGCEPDLFEQTCIESPGNTSRWISRCALFKSYLEHPDGFGLNLSRGAFDRALFAQAERAGASVFEHTGFVDATRAVGGGWTIMVRAGQVTKSLSAKLVVDASGRTSAFARRQGGSSSRGMSDANHSPASTSALGPTHLSSAVHQSC